MRRAYARRYSGKIRDLPVKVKLVSFLAAISIVSALSACGPSYPHEIEDLQKEVMSCKAESGIWTEAMNCVDRVAKSSTLDVDTDDLAYLWDECDHPEGSTELEACLVVFNNNLKTREPEMQRIATIESENYSDVLMVTDVTAKPRDCLRVSWNDFTVNVTCNYDVRATAAWSTLVKPAYIHCQTWNPLARDISWSSYELTGESGSIDIHVVGNPGGHLLPDRDPHDLVPEAVPENEQDLYIPLECILSPRPAEDYVFDGNQSLTARGSTDWIASARCERQELAQGSESRYCFPAYDDIRAGLNVGWVEASKAQIGAE